MKYALLLLLTAACLVALASCGDSVKVDVNISTGPALQDSWLSSDAEGKNRVTSFAPTDTIHVKADLVRAKAGTAVEAKFIAVKVDHPDVAPETEVDAFTQAFDGTLNRMNFDFANDSPMPSGGYRIELRVDGGEPTTLPFTIPAS